MKKMMFLVMLVFTVMACTPNAKEIEQKRYNDSIYLVDSISKVEAQNKFVADSIAHEDSIKSGLIKVKK